MGLLAINVVQTQPGTAAIRTSPTPPLNLMSETALLSCTDRVGAVVVSFHPDLDVIANLASLCEQVRSVVVVDNGSPPESLSILREAGQRLAFTLIENRENLGIAQALNIGIQWADSNNCAWILLFDQDSTVTEHFVSGMLRYSIEASPNKNVGIVVPRYIDNRSGAAIPAIPIGSYGIETAMTSGSLIRTSIFRDRGLFVEDLFIDAVDYEFSLRLRKGGLCILECPHATLLHSPGDPRVHRLRGRYLFKTANYSPTRRYYQERNKVWVTRRYWKHFPWFCLKLYWFSVKDCLKVILAEDDKFEKLRFGARGLLDGFHERMGKLPG